MVFSVELRHAEQTRRYSISLRSDRGWEVAIERDGEPSHRAHYRDWHRVERALNRMQLEVSELTDQGWHRV
jgi:hypothetical protein